MRERSSCVLGGLAVAGEQWRRRRRPSLSQCHLLPARARTVAIWLTGVANCCQEKWLSYLCREKMARRRTYGTRDKYGSREVVVVPAEMIGAQRPRGGVTTALGLVLGKQLEDQWR